MNPSADQWRRFHIQELKHIKDFMIKSMQKDKLSRSDIVLNICVPVYRTEKHLSMCIQSVLKQDYCNFRLVLVDDGSPDQCGVICDQYAANDGRIFVIHQENQGQIMARQAALHFVQGMVQENEINKNYIIFLDSDDTLKEHALETIVQKVQETPCDILIYGIDWVQDGRVVGKFQGKTKPFVGTVTDKATLYQIILGDVCYNSLCRKAIAAALTLDKDCSQYKHLRHGEDLLQSLEYLKDAKKTVFIEESLYNYTINHSSVTHSLSADNYSADTIVREAILDFLEAENVWDQEAYKQYFRYCEELLFGEVIRVSNFSASLEKRISLLEQIRRNSYYHRLLVNGENKKWTLKCLKRAKYKQAILFAKLYELLRVIYRYLR